MNECNDGKRILKGERLKNHRDMTGREQEMRCYIRNIRYRNLFSVEM